MKFFRFGPAGHERPGAYDRDGVKRDISDLITDLGGRSLSPTNLAAIARRDLSGCPIVSERERFGPCVTGVRNFIAVGLNYADHAAESGAEVPAEPILFNKAPSCIVGPDDNVCLPPQSMKADWEVELAVVIGGRAWCLAESDVPAVIAGYCICNDVSERSFQLDGTGQWMKGKGCPTFGPLGPYLVTADEIADVQSLDIWLKLNGEWMQRATTRDMIFGVHYLVSYVSHFMTLEPGDIIATGTPPGVGLGRKPPRYLRPGDVMQLGIEGLGMQRQEVTWGVTQPIHDDAVRAQV